MKILTWNMGCAFGSKYRAAHADAWAVIESLDPDIALLQEVALVPESIDPTCVVRAPRASGAAFHTVIYVRRGSVVRLDSDVSLAAALSGQAVLAEISSLDTENLIVASVHTRTGPPRAADRELFDILPPSVRSQLPRDAGSWNAHIILMSIDAHVKKRRFVAGGDFNLAWRFDEMQGGRQNYWASAQFKEHRDRGWRRCHLKFHAGEERTLFRGRDELYQLDHFFADEETYRQTTRCDVINLDERDRLSDHAPMILEIGTGAGA